MDPVSGGVQRCRPNQDPRVQAGVEPGPVDASPAGRVDTESDADPVCRRGL